MTVAYLLLTRGRSGEADPPLLHAALDLPLYYYFACRLF
jgi:hypothetical protein